MNETVHRRGRTLATMSAREDMCCYTLDLVNCRYR
jgi:hypothetical protein